MRYLLQPSRCFAFCFALLFALFAPGASQCRESVSEEDPSSSVVWEMKRVEGTGGSFVEYPVFLALNDADAPLADAINAAALEQARIPEYLQLLQTITEGGTGLKVRCALSASVREAEGGQWEPDGRYVSILFSIHGKMLSGRPSQAYCAMTIDLQTGDRVSFDQLFSDPDGARAFIDSELQEKIEPELSTYLENNQLFPVPYDSFFLDNQGGLTLFYENSQLSFLSGFSGAVSFRYSELSPWTDPGEGILAGFAQNLRGTAGDLSARLSSGSLFPEKPSLALLAPLDAALSEFRPAADSSFYPGGACYELEEASLRGTFILTDEQEEKITGFLSCRIDLPGIFTGKTLLSEAEALFSQEPAIRMETDASLAELYRVCPGTACVYLLASPDGAPAACTLYADSDGIVQFIKLSVQ